jgi:nicotinamidase-related amidase
MGIATSGGVESMPRRALDLGHNLVLIHDAMTDRDTRYTPSLASIGGTGTTGSTLKLFRE